MAARTVSTVDAVLFARGGGVADFAFGRREGACELLVMWLRMYSEKAFLKMKSHQPIIRHGDRAYNAAGV
jgi:hypothetical protein